MKYTGVPWSTKLRFWGAGWDMEGKKNRQKGLTNHEVIEEKR